MPLQGAEWFKSRLRTIKERAPAALGAALYQEGVLFVSEAMRRVPIDTGRGRASGFVEPPQNMRVRAGFGAGYLLWVESITTLQHRVGQAHFFRDSWNKVSSGRPSRLLKRCLQNIREGIGLEPAEGIASEQPDPRAARLEREAIVAQRRGRAARIRGQNASRARGRR